MRFRSCIDFYNSTINVGALCWSVELISVLRFKIDCGEVGIGGKTGSLVVALHMVVMSRTNASCNDVNVMMKITRKVKT